MLPTEQDSTGEGYQAVTAKRIEIVWDFKMVKNASLVQDCTVG